MTLRLLMTGADQPYIYESDIPKVCFEPISAEADPKDTDLNPVSIEMPLSLLPQKKKSQTKNQTKKRQGINFKMQKNQLRTQLLSTMKLCLVQKKILKHRKRMKRLSTWSSGSPFLRTNQRGSRNTIFWIHVSLIIIFNHKNNFSSCTLPCCLAYISLTFSYP